MKRKPPKLDKPYPRHRVLSPGETELWHETMGKKVDSPSPFREREGERVNLQKHPLLAPPPEGQGNPVDRKKAPLKTPSAHLDRTTRTKIRRGLVSVKAKLDLHGLTKAEAHSAVLHFIAKQQARGVSLALIITGKGRKGAGALREELPRWLSESPLREAIIAYDVAGPRHGGEGAWYVRIRRLKV